MVRRPMTTLVEQGIMPSPKTSPALHEQKQRLERAKTHDILRSKIARRPDRQELVHRHILEDVRPGVDPSLCDKQRQLKRAKLADSLSNQLLLRPGPLELIQKNILHPEDRNIEQAVKEGQIAFKPTNEGIPIRHVELPLTYASFDDDSNSEGIKSPEDFSPAASTPRFGGLSPMPMDSVASSLSPSHAAIFSPFSPTLPTTPLPASTTLISLSSPVPSKSESHSNISNLQKTISEDTSSAFTQHQRRASDVGLFAVPFTTQLHGVTQTTQALTTPSRSSSSSSTSSTSLTLSKTSQLLPGSQAYSQREAPGKDQTSRKSKKAKPKGQTSKQRTIKFHEYKVRYFCSSSRIPRNNTSSKFLKFYI